MEDGVNKCLSTIDDMVRESCSEEVLRADDQEELRTVVATICFHQEEAPNPRH